MIKKKFIFIIDILTAILLLLQMESLTLYILDSLGGRTLFSILAYYQCEGVILDISFSPVGKIFILAVFILFSMNFVVVIFKLIDFFSKEKILKAVCRYLIIMNIIFVIWRLIEYGYLIVGIMIR
jgi:hypothetical protein